VEGRQVVTKVLTGIHVVDFNQSPTLACGGLDESTGWRFSRRTVVIVVIDNDQQVVTSRSDRMRFNYNYKFQF
jgi:hypothetical protein